MARLFVTYLTCFCLCFCLTFAAAAKVGISDKNFNWEKVDLGALLQVDKITMQEAEQAVTALIYAPGAATEHNAVAICEQGVFGLQNQVKIKLQAEREAATDEADAAARLATVRHEYMIDLVTCVREAAQHSNVRDALNKAVESAKASNIQLDTIAALEQQKKSVEEEVSRLSGGNVSLTDADDSGNVDEVVGSGNSSETIAVSVNSDGKPDGKPDGGNSMLERIAAGIRTIDAIIKALREGDNTITSDSFKNALKEIQAAHAEAAAASADPVMTELLATTVKRNTHIQSPAERVAVQQQIKARSRRSGANQLGEKPRKAVAVEKQDTVLELLNELSETEKAPIKRRLLGAKPDDSAALSDTGVATKRADGATAQLLSDAVEIKAGDSDKATAKWGHRHHWHHSHHNHHWHHSHWPHWHHNHHSHHRHSPQIGSSPNRAKIAAFMTSSSYKDENTIRGYMANTAHTQGESWEFVKFYSGSSGVQRFVAKSGNKAVVAFRGSEAISDWLANFNMIPVPWGPGWVHMGFLSQFQDQQADLDTQLDSLTRDGVNDILITGHSLGGALSWLATYYIKNRYPSATVEVLTFAAPSAASTGFMNWIYSNVAHHNHVVYQYDPVPCVPPGYTEQGQMRHYTAEWQTVWWGWDTWYDSRMHSCWTCLAVWDHSMFHYCDAVGAGSSGCPAAY